MNVLIFVMTMIMLLSLLTYARLETYFSGQIFQEVFNNYMEKQERGYINAEVDTTYKDIRVTQGAKRLATPRVAATRNLSLVLLQNKKERESKLPEWQQRVILLKNLINILYADQPFFQKLQKERPFFLDEMINELVQVVDTLPQEQKLKKASDLANLKLPDPELDTALYKMLHGAIALQPSEKMAEVQEKAEGEGEQEEVQEYKSPEGYFSLLDYINLSTQSKIRIFLAPRQVLMAIFHDPTLVDTILAERKVLYREAAGKVDPKELEKKFRSQFDPRHDSAIDSSLLDYSVTKTNPKLYE
jgi:hypothetical protein